MSFAVLPEYNLKDTFKDLDATMKNIEELIPPVAESDRLKSHIIGDKLLKEVASVLEGLCRSEDVLIRFGGEEFVVLMSDTFASEAGIFVERVREKFTVTGKYFILFSMLAWIFVHQHK